MLQEFGRSQPVENSQCQAKETSFVRSCGRVIARRMHDKFCELERSFQQNVKDVSEELKEADQLGGEWDPVSEEEGASGTRQEVGVLDMSSHCHQLDVEEEI